MQATDAVKLIYQSEFAGGHMVSSEAQSEKRMKEERRTAKAECAPSFAFEDIGGGLCRMHLGALAALGLAASTANRFFLNTADAVRGDAARFERKLSVLLECCRAGALPFDAEETAAYIAALRAKGYPPASHSEPYRLAYAPAYRVVSADYRGFIEVFCRIDALMKKGEPVRVAIDGRSAAGKSRLAELIKGVYRATVFHMDDFFLPSEKRTPQRLAEPGGNVDFERFLAEAATGIKSGGGVFYRAYDCKTGVLGEPIKAAPAPLRIVEGAYSLHPALFDLYDLKIFLGVGKEEQRRRILQRNGEALLRRFTEEWIPLEEEYIAALQIPRRCDIVYDGE